MAGDANLEVRVTTSGATEATAQIEGLRQEVAATNTATAAAGDAALKGEAGLAALAAEAHAAATATQATAVGAEAAAAGVGLFGRAVSLLAGPLGLFILALSVLPELLGKIGELSTKFADWLVSLAEGLDNATGATDKQGKALDEMTDAGQKALDATAQLTRAQALMAAGLIPATANTKLLLAEASLYMSTFHGAAASTDDFAEALKQMGLKAIESFGDLQTEGKNFISAYQFYLQTQGPEAARIFAEQNKASLDAVVSRYVKMGTDIPPELKKIESDLGVLSAAETEAAKDKGLADRYERDLRRMGDQTVDLLKKVGDLGEEALRTRDKIEQSAKDEIAASDAKTAKTIRGLQDEVAKTEAAHAARTISDTEYNTKINTLFAQEAQARTDGFEAEKKIKDDEKALLDKNVADRDAAGKQIIEKLDDISTKEGETRANLDLLTQKITSQREATDLASIGFVGLSKQFGDTSSGALALAGIVSGLTANMRDLEQAANAASAAMARVTDGSGGSGGSTAESEPTTAGGGPFYGAEGF